ncbi:MAG: hypothetical protein AAFR61_25340 [Bacteroidota bacterium]
MRYCLFFLLWLLGASLLGQTMIDWPLLNEVSYIKGVDLRTGYLVERPRFSKALKKLDGDLVEIEGYIVPLDITGSRYVLSQFPYASCFFCGRAGLSSVMDVWFVDRSKRYVLDDRLKLRGYLRLSDSGEGLMYLLDEAEEIE